MFEYHHFGRNQTILSNWAQIGGKFSGESNDEAIRLNDHSSLFSTSTVCFNMKQSILRLLLPRILLTGFVHCLNCEKIVGFRLPCRQNQQAGSPQPRKHTKTTAGFEGSWLSEGTSLWGQLHPVEDGNFSKGSKFQDQHKGDSHDSKSILTNPNVRKKSSELDNFWWWSNTTWKTLPWSIVKHLMEPI